MSSLEGVITAARVIATLIGLIVVLMWAAGALGLADFRLVFIVPAIRT